MAQTTQAREISLQELQENFGLQLVSDSNFFSEWTERLEMPSDREKQILNRVKSNYLNLSSHRTLSEEAVKMVVLSPLLDLAGFYQPPFVIEREAPVEISADNEGVIVKGTIDILVIQKRLWVLVIESKSTKFDVTIALPQALIYMLDSPNLQKPTFGLLVNGREFVFLKMVREANPKYSLSYALSIDRKNELYQVLSILKHLGQLITIIE